jgi:hypothetical protein
MSNGWKPKERYKTSGISSKGRAPTHLTSTDYTEGFKQAKVLEEKRVEEALAKEELEIQMVLKGLGIGQSVLDTRAKKNKAWMLTDTAKTYKGMQYEGEDVFDFSDDFLTQGGYTKASLDWKPSILDKFSDSGELQKFLESDEGMSIMRAMHNDPSRFTRMSPFNRQQWNYVMGLDPEDIQSTFQGWIDDPSTTPREFLDWRTTPNKNEAEWLSGFGIEDDETLQQFTKGCFGARGGSGCFGGP